MGRYRVGQARRESSLPVTGMQPTRNIPVAATHQTIGNAVSNAVSNAVTSNTRVNLDGLSQAIKVGLPSSSGRPRDSGNGTGSKVLKVQNKISKQRQTYAGSIDMLGSLSHY